MTVSMTPPTPARHPVTPQRTPTPPKGGPPPNPARKAPLAPRPNRYGEVIDAIRGRGVPYTPNDVDAGAVKRSALTPERIAECYAAIATGEWGDGFNQRSLTVQHAIRCWNAYAARGLNPEPAPTSALDRVLRQIANDPVEGPSTWR